MSLLQQLNWRYATKRMNGTKVPQNKIDNILEAIRLTPTSYGFQAFKVFAIENPELREKIFNAACPQPQIKEGSHILVFAADRKVTAESVDAYMQLMASTRGIPVEALDGFKAAFDPIVAGSVEQNFVWTARQTYIALGVAMVAAAEEEVDATPIEGFNPAALDEVLGLGAQNLGSVTILALGYRDAEADKLANAPKVRKSSKDLIVNL
ncbi:MAG: nitroreductase [Bacteroidetes bacterium]|jgi:nitroreductase|nr:nitroreductase [Bacteroidota bacterium]